MKKERQQGKAGRCLRFLIAQKFKLFDIHCRNISTLQAFPWLRPSIRGLPLQSSSFDHRPHYASLVFVQVAVEMVLLRPPWISVSIYQSYRYISGTAVEQLVEALRYKSEGRGFDYRWCHWNFSLT